MLHYVSLQNLQQSSEAEVTLLQRGIFIFTTVNQSQVPQSLFLLNIYMHL